MSFINLRSASYGRRASTNSVEQTIIQKLSGVNLNSAAPLSPSVASLVKEDAAFYGLFPWQHRSAEALNRTDEVLSDRDLLGGELRDGLIRLNTRIPPAQDQALIATGAFIAFTVLRSAPKPDKLEA
jgi:hypothetical protein